jgi:chemotaxis response regulator CheB
MERTPKPPMGKKSQSRSSHLRPGCHTTKRGTRLALDHRDIVVIGASAGGLEAIGKILAALPHDLDSAVLIVLHTANRAESLLPRTFERAGNLPASHPRDREPVERGKVYIAPSRISHDC